MQIANPSLFIVVCLLTVAGSFFISSTILIKITKSDITRLKLLSFIIAALVSAYITNLLCGTILSHFMGTEEALKIFYGWAYPILNLLFSFSVATVFLKRFFGSDVKIWELVAFLIMFFVCNFIISHTVSMIFGSSLAR